MDDNIGWNCEHITNDVSSYYPVSSWGLHLRDPGMSGNSMEAISGKADPVPSSGSRGGGGGGAQGARAPPFRGTRACASHCRVYYKADCVDHQLLFTCGKVYVPPPLKFWIRPWFPPLTVVFY